MHTWGMLTHLNGPNSRSYVFDQILARKKDMYEEEL